MNVAEAIKLRKFLGLKEKPELTYPPCDCWACNDSVCEKELFGRARGKVHCESCHRYFSQPG